MTFGVHGGCARLPWYVRRYVEDKRVSNVVPEGRRVQRERPGSKSCDVYSVESPPRLREAMKGFDSLDKASKKRESINS